MVYQGTMQGIIRRLSI